jgi:hypothetical protein
VYGRKNDRDVLLATQKYVIQDLKDLKASVSGKRKGFISKQSLMAESRINIESELIRNDQTKVTGFQIQRISKQDYKNSIEDVTNKGHIFNEKTKELLAKAEKGDVYIFKRIEVSNIHNNSVGVPPVVLTIN